MHGPNTAVDAILTAETLLQELRSLAPQLQALLAGDVSDALGRAQHIYPAIWSQLDRAREHTRGQGIAVPAYDELRARQPAALLGAKVNLRDPIVRDEFITALGIVGGVGGVAIGTVAHIADSIGAKTADANVRGINDATGAAAALRDAMPDVPWVKLRAKADTEAAAYGQALGAHRRKRILIGAAVVAGLVGIVLAIVLVLGASREDEKQAPLTLRQEIAMLRDRLQANPCMHADAEQLVQKLRFNGQTRAAREFGQDFLARCGDNEFIRKRVSVEKPGE